MLPAERDVKRSAEPKLGIRIVPVHNGSQIDLLAILEVLAKFPRFKGVAQNSRLILGLVAAASVIAAFLGWMLSQAGGYDPQLLPWHKWSGFAVAVACTLAWLLNWLGRPRAYQISLLATLVALANIRCVLLTGLVNIVELKSRGLGEAVARAQQAANQPSGRSYTAGQLPSTHARRSSGRFQRLAHQRNTSVLKHFAHCCLRRPPVLHDSPQV